MIANFLFLLSIQRSDRAFETFELLILRIKCNKNFISNKKTTK